MGITGKKGVCIGTLLLLLVSGRMAVCYSRESRRSLSQAENFVCYYGTRNENLLSQFDIVILESRNYTAQGIKKIKARGAKVIGYLSLGEDPKLRKGTGKGVGGYSDYYLDMDRNGTPDKNKNWGSYYVNPGHPEWVELICRQAKEILEKGCDGFFLDTLDTVEIYPRTRGGMVRLIKHLRSEFNDAIIVANRGIVILNRIASVIDGEMVESFTSTYDWKTKSYRKLNDEEIRLVNQLAERILDIRKANAFIVLILDYTREDDFATMEYCRKRAKKFGFLCSFSNINLSKIYPVRVH